MKILALMAQHHWTGPAEPELLKLAKLKARGHQVLFCFTRKPAGSLAEKVAELGFDSFEEVILYRKRPAPISLLRDVRILKRTTAEDPPDIVHCHLSHDHWTGLQYVKKFREKPVLVRSIHEERKLKPSFGDRLLFSSTDGFIVPGESFARRLTQEHGMEAASVEIVPGNVDTERFRTGLESTAFRNELNAEPNAPLIGIVSRIKPERGHERLFTAFRNLMRDYPSAKLVIVGRGEGEEKLREQHNDLVKAGRVHFTGYRSDDLPEILNALTVKVLLAPGSDATCRAILEAMACGTPVIASKIGVLPDTVTDGQTGYLVKPGEVESLERSIRSALDHPEELEAIGKNARERVLERHDLERTTDKVEKFYRRLMEEKKR
jgi:L-malate glycosyltransferase